MDTCLAHGNMDNLSRADVSQRYKSGADLCLRITGVTAITWRRSIQWS
jgi:hypothetical protein